MKTESDRVPKQTLAKSGVLKVIVVNTPDTFLSDKNVFYPR